MALRGELPLASLRGQLAYGCGLRSLVVGISADGISSIAVSNGVARIELVQLRKTKVGKARLLPEPVAMLFVPATGLQQMTQQLVEAARHIEKQETARAERAEAAKDASAADEALTNL